VVRANQVWGADITYVPLRRGFLYLVAVLDWSSRYVLAWALSNTLEARFCLEAVDQALARGRPEIFNTDQGAQFTGEAFTGRLAEARIRLSMDGRGRALDNVFVERLWRSVKYEEVYLRDYADGAEAWRGLHRYFVFYNTERRHQSLGRRTPAEVHFG
jgi:putative transposase